MVKTIGYHVQKLFSHLPDKTIDELALASIKQFEEEGYKGVGYQSLFDAIHTAYAHPDSIRMQTGISKAKIAELNKFPWDWRTKHAQKIIGPDGEKAILFPRRLITTYQTEYHPSNFILGMKEYERLNFLSKVYGTDTRLIARLAREELKEVCNAAFERNVNYGLLVTLTTDSSTLHSEGRPLEDSSGKIYPYIRKPKIIIPKSTKEEREILDTFCNKYQIPNKQFIDKLLGITD